MQALHECCDLKDVSIYGSLSLSVINAILKKLLTKKRLETKLDFGSSKNEETGKILPPYNTRDLIKKLGIEDLRVSKGNEIANFWEYKRRAKKLSLCLVSLYCKTKFLEE